MSDFKLFFPTLLKHEGGFVNDPADPGKRIVPVATAMHHTRIRDARSAVIYEKNEK